jgi:peroxiredoxin Q/BCP
MGVDRSTFIIDETGKILYLWRGVKVKGHVDEVLTKLKELV